jgi:7,8-dihydroneopterin aldolase/epimerase/oxygenase
MLLDVRIGIHKHEQSSAQPVKISVELYNLAPYRPIGRALDQVIDYDRVRNYVITWRDREQVALIEELLSELVDFCFGDERVDAVRASIVKTTIFRETREAGVEVFCTRESWNDRDG